MQYLNAIVKNMAETEFMTSCVFIVWLQFMWDVYYDVYAVCAAFKHGEWSDALEQMMYKINWAKCNCSIISLLACYLHSLT